MRPLSILLFYDCIYPESVGGVEHRNAELARALAARGHRVTLAGFASGRSQPQEGVEILPVGPRGRLYTGAGKRSTAEAARLAAAAARIDLRPFDVVEAANIPYAHLPVLAARCRLLGKPFVVTWYEYWGRYWREYLGARWPVYAAVERLTVPLGTRALADSHLTASRVETRRHEEVLVIPVGIPAARIREAALAGAAEPGPPLVYAGRLLREKRVDLLLEAVARLAPRLQHWPGPLLAVIGDGPDRERLAALAGQLKLQTAVTFHGHLPTNVDVWRTIGASRIAVQPSSREGFGLFPLEAMAAGLPVVYCESSESALSELVEPGVHGACTPPQPDALAIALDRLLADPEETRRLAGNALRHAARYDWSSVAADMEKVFLSLLASDS
jgi:glycosyltransferase involved in cell wall biosynthesis